MAETTGVAWAHSTYNPWRGCTKVSDGCTNCYAETLSRRNPGVLGVWGDNGTRVVASDAMWREPLKWDRRAGEAGERRRVFCASLADVFEDRPELVGPRARLWRLIGATPNLDWMLLTKRPANVLPALEQVWGYQKDRLLRDDCLSAWIDGSYPPLNVWLGVSVEDQARADERIPHLLRTPASVRFLSVEPMLGPVQLGLFRVAHPKHRESWPAEAVKNFWVIVGGESGPKARPMDPAWLRSVADQCESAGVPLFVKQDSGPKPGAQGRIPDDLWALKQFPDPTPAASRPVPSRGGDPS